jgi:hypothetical protein
MKRGLYVLIGVIFLLSCSPDNNKSKVDEPIHTLIFMDKSLSLNTNQAYVSEKYDQVLDEIVAKNIRTTGDRITVYFIHENTAKARALSLTVRSEMDDISHASPTDVEAAEVTFDLSLQREKARFRQQLQGKIAQVNKGLSNQRTDILASIPIIADAAAEGQTVNVYYLSDMVESMVSQKATGRDFHKTPPADEAQANEWAKADAKLLGDVSLGSAEIKIALPFEPTASRKVNNPTITLYWQTLFSELGVSEVEEL